MFRTPHLKPTLKYCGLVVGCAGMNSPRYWREQFYLQLSALSSEANTLAHAGPHCQAHTCVSRRDGWKVQESTSKVRNLKISRSKVSKEFDSEQIFNRKYQKNSIQSKFSIESIKRIQFRIESIKRINFSVSPSHLRAYWNIDRMRCSEINDQAKKENLTRVNVAKFYFCLKFALVLVVFVCRQCVEIRRLHSRDRFLSSMLEQNKFILTPSEAELSSFGGFAKTILVESYSVRR